MLYSDEPVKRVFKYKLRAEGYQEIDMPLDAEILSAQVQGGDIFLWALIDDSANGFPQTRTIRIAGTGHPIVGNVKFIDTVQLEGGSLVFHVFEVL